MEQHWGRLRPIGLSESIQDARRAERFSGNLANLVRAEAGDALAIDAIDNRLATIAITENASAFNAQRHIEAQYLAEKFGMVEIWDAQLDKRTCDECWRMDGQRAIVGAGFLGGLVPGLVHARCRCTSHFERIP